jgi:CHAT domain-containing protein
MSFCYHRHSQYRQKAEGRHRPRLHWCSSGDFALLPLHAAGIYEGDDPVCAENYIVSSYTPSLSALIKSREDFKPVRREELQVLLFSEASAPGLSHVPSVEDEVQMIAGIVISASASVVNNICSPPMVDSVLEQASSAHVLHLACHGHQHEDPLKSCFALHDGRLTISALMDLKLPKAMLAYLSACETAKGDKKQPDQAVHLAASMLFCGFRSVVAAMWYVACKHKTMIKLTRVSVGR